MQPSANYNAPQHFSNMQVRRISTGIKFNLLSLKDISLAWYNRMLGCSVALVMDPTEHQLVPIELCKQSPRRRTRSRVIDV